MIDRFIPAFISKRKDGGGDRKPPMKTTAWRSGSWVASFSPVRPGKAGLEGGGDAKHF
jgi:hypothetical protein